MLRNKVKNIEIRYTYQIVNSKTGIDKFLENNNINHAILLIYWVFVKGAQRKEQMIAPFAKRFKAASLRRLQ